MQEFVTHFGIDWKLFLAQIVNFSVILFVLRKFAYQPILKMLRDRRDMIAQGIEMAKDAEKNLRESDEMRNRTLQQAHTDALGIVNRAEQIGKDKQDEIMKQTDAKVEGVIANARRVIDQEKAKMSSDLMSEAEDLVRMSLGKVLGKMPAKERDLGLIQDAIKELKAVN